MPNAKYLELQQECYETPYPREDYQSRIQSLSNQLYVHPRRIWVTREGHVVPLVLMRESHLFNAYRYTVRRLHESLDEVSEAYHCVVLAIEYPLDVIETVETFIFRFEAAREIRAEIIRRKKNVEDLPEDFAVKYNLYVRTLRNIKGLWCILRRTPY